VSSTQEIRVVNIYLATFLECNDCRARIVIEAIRKAVFFFEDTPAIRSLIGMYPKVQIDVGDFVRRFKDLKGRMFDDLEMAGVKGSVSSRQNREVANG